MGVTQYIGARYMPIFADPPEHSSAKTYEPLTIVLHEGNSYTSKQFVPKGIAITNETYWAETGNYNAQVEAYRRETLQALDAATTAQNDIDTLLPKADFSAENTVKKSIELASMSLADEIQNPYLCVSTYTEEALDGSLALSLDGATWTEVRESIGFSNNAKTDCACYEIDEGLLILTTGSSVSGNFDFYATFTKDFRTFETQTVSLGFLDISKDVIGNNAYVWTPALIFDNDKIYLTCSVGLSVPTDIGTDVYYISNNRTLSIYACEVTIGTDPLTFTKVGTIGKINIPHDSVMDGTILKHGNYYYAAYKDRVYNVVNIGRSVNLYGPYTDINTVLGNSVFIEASWLMFENNTPIVYACCYGIMPAHTIRFTLNNDLTKVIAIDYVHLTNPRIETYKMRNPYPVKMSNELWKKFQNRYNINNIFTGGIAPILQKRPAVSNSLALASKVLYDAYQKYIRVPVFASLSPSTRPAFDNIYVSNDCEIRNINRDITINTESGSTVEIPKTKNVALMVSYKSGLLSVNVENNNEPETKNIEYNGLTITVTKFSGLCHIAISGAPDTAIANNTILNSGNPLPSPYVGNINVPYISSTNNISGMFSISTSGFLRWYGTQIGANVTTTVGMEYFVNE